MAWTAATAVSGALMWRRAETSALAFARTEAAANLNKDRAFRYWATEHGGVYVPPTATAPPNPYLAHIPDRDVVTQEGKRLTLVNPAYMLRRMMEQYEALYGIKGRLVSTLPLNPINTPDPWEERALAELQSGAREFSERTVMDGRPVLRMMEPFRTEEGCLKCHGQQGYRVGDLRGGVGVAIPLGPYLTAARQQQEDIALAHGGIWLLGLVGLGLGWRSGRVRIDQQGRSELGPGPQRGTPVLRHAGGQ
ncbi:Phytochrome, two-component sensor histidine kinase Cyanobacterial phytochrome B (fragment) [Magnetospirillum sp. UT-4]